MSVGSPAEGGAGPMASRSVARGRRRPAAGRRPKSRRPRPHSRGRNRRPARPRPSRVRPTRRGSFRGCRGRRERCALSPASRKAGSQAKGRRYNAALHPCRRPHHSGKSRGPGQTSDDVPTTGETQILVTLSIPMAPRLKLRTFSLTPFRVNNLPSDQSRSLACNPLRIDPRSTGRRVARAEAAAAPVFSTVSLRRLFHAFCDPKRRFI